MYKPLCDDANRPTLSNKIVRAGNTGHGEIEHDTLVRLSVVFAEHHRWVRFRSVRRGGGFEHC